MLSVLALDPGPERTAYVHLREGVPARFGLEANQCIRRVCEDAQTWGVDGVAIEMVASYGMAVGAEVFETCVWIGRFMESLIRCNVSNSEIHRIPRIQVKNHLCHKSNANDSNIRQAIIDRFGGMERGVTGRKCEACKGRKMVGLGKKRGPCAACAGSGWAIQPGPLCHIHADIWSAVAVGLTLWDQHKPAGYAR